MVNKKGGGSFSSHDESLLVALCEIVALAMFNAFSFQNVSDLRDRLSMIISTIHSYVCTFTTDGRLDSCNRALEGVLGISQQALRERSFEEVMKERGGGLEQLGANLAECMATGVEVGRENLSVELVEGGRSYITYYVVPMLEAGRHDGEGGSPENEQV